MELKVMTWNIQGAAVLSWNKSYEIKKELVLEDNDYIWFMTNRTGKNGILIFIKKHLVDKKKLVHSLYQGNTILSNTDDCNILRVTLPVFQNKTLTLMGVRMETGTTEASKVSLKAQYDAERKALDQVLFPKIEPPNDMYIVCGDFNNARCLGDLTKRFNLEDYQGYAQSGYNLNIIKDAFDGIGFTMADIGDTNRGIPSWRGYIPIFVRGFENIKQCERESADSLSDHDIIWAKLEY